MEVTKGWTTDDQVPIFFSYDCDMSCQGTHVVACARNVTTKLVPATNECSPAGA